MSEDGNQKQLGILASITAAMEVTQTEIKSIQIRTNAGAYEARVRLAVPLNGVHSLDRARIETDHTEFVDNNLQFDMTVAIDTSDQHSLNTSQSSSQEQTTVRSHPTGESEQPEQPSRRAHPAVRSGDGDNRADDTDPTETAEEGVTGAEHGADEQDGQAADTDDREELPEYQDPEQLAAVYEENGTFEEMRQKLDVDVTAQTVRKYMIKHGIHEPEPRPDRLLEAIHASELELMTTEDEGQPGQTGSATDPDADTS